MFIVFTSINMGALYGYARLYVNNINIILKMA